MVCAAGTSVVREIQVIQIHRVRRLLGVPVHLVIDGHTVPGGRGWIVVTIQGIGCAIQGDGLEQQAIIRSSLRLNH